jgi:hypothetical protein
MVATARIKDSALKTAVFAIRNRESTSPDYAPTVLITITPPNPINVKTKA